MLMLFINYMFVLLFFLVPVMNRQIHPIAFARQVPATRLPNLTPVTQLSNLAPVPPSCPIIINVFYHRIIIII